MGCAEDRRSSVIRLMARPLRSRAHRHATHLAAALDCKDQGSPSYVRCVTRGRLSRRSGQTAWGAGRSVAAVAGKRGDLAASRRSRNVRDSWDASRPSLRRLTSESGFSRQRVTPVCVHRGSVTESQVFVDERAVGAPGTERKLTLSQPGRRARVEETKTTAGRRSFSVLEGH